MKTHSIRKSILFPVFLSLFLLPVLSCMIFQQATKQYTYKEATETLAQLREDILPLIQETFDHKNHVSMDETRPFFRKTSAALKENGLNAQILMYTADMRLVYPHSSEEKASVSSVATACIPYFSRLTDDDQALNSLQLDLKDTGSYLMDIYCIPGQLPQVRYLVIYAPTSQMDQWIMHTSKIVLAVSFCLTAIICSILYFIVWHITDALKKLSAETERIGKGDFAPISRSFHFSELENLHLAIDQMSGQLKNSEEMQQHFFQNVSHDLRTPLMSISGYAQGIEQGVFSDPVPAAKTILEESTRLTKLVNSLLTLSRLENTFSDCKMEQISIYDIAADCLDRIGMLAREKQIRLIAEEPKQELTVLGNGELLSKILDNLFSNALRYAKTCIYIGFSTDNAYLSLTVKDDGPGISPEDLPYIFDRCYKGKGGNFGIGLTIAKTAAHSMNGTLTAKNAPEGGAIFTLTLKASTL